LWPFDLIAWRRGGEQRGATGLVFGRVAMISAAYGFIPPTQGALLQEAIDVAVILNALRASWS
jgi:cation transport ATPase